MPIFHTAKNINKFKISMESLFKSVKFLSAMQMLTYSVFMLSKMRNKISRRDRSFDTEDILTHDQSDEIRRASLTEKMSNVSLIYLSRHYFSWNQSSRYGK